MNFEATLDQLGVLPADRRDLIEARPDPDLVQESAVRILVTFGQRDSAPALPQGTDSYFAAHVCLALLPHIRSYHRSRDIPDDVSWATLRVLADNLARHRRIYGVGGLDGSRWVVRVYRGLAYRLGRLVFECAHVGPPLAAVRPDLGPLDDALGVHVPSSGPLIPAECDEAFSRAVRFFGEHFPEQVLGPAHCHSWLLDPQLADYLPAQSNIVRFASRFRLLPNDDENDRAIVRWVFESADPANLDALTAKTSLERAVLGHLRAGGQWRERRGWLELY